MKWQRSELSKGKEEEEATREGGQRRQGRANHTQILKNKRKAKPATTNARKQTARAQKAKKGTRKASRPPHSKGNEIRGGTHTQTENRPETCK